MTDHQFLRDLVLGNSISYVAGRYPSSESGNEQSVAIVYFSRLWQCFVKQMAWIVYLYIIGSYNLLITLRVHAQINFNTSLQDRRLDFSKPFHAVMNFRLANRGHVIIQGIFAPHLGKVVPLKHGQRYSTGIGMTYSKVKLYCIFIDVSAKDTRISYHFFLLSTV